MAGYTLSDLPYDYAALEPAVSGEILELHHARHHAAYVKGANDTIERLAELRATGAAGASASLVGLEKTLAFNLSGHTLHDMFWRNLSPDGGDRPAGELAAAIDEHFGSFDGFRQELTGVTAGVQGSGWGALSWDPLGRRLLVHQIYDHQGNVHVGGAPLLVFDAWEHAYYLQYRNVRPDYVERLWTLVNWADVQARFTAAAG